MTDFLTNNQTYVSSRPKAFLNWMIVDEEFKKVSSSFHMGAVQVPLINSTTTQKQPLVGPANMTVRRNGWLYVYVSNESNQDVYFDDLVINHKRGPVVDVNSYYAFGLTIAGISSKALGFGGNENRFKFNEGTELQSKEFSDGSGLEIYETPFRGYDPQIGRFMQIDPLAEIADGWSPYSFAYDNPVIFNDPLGLVVPGTPTAGDPNNPVEVIITACRNCKTPPIGSNIDVAGAVGPPPASVGNPVSSPTASTAGLPAYPLSPLTPVGPPGKVVPFDNPVRLLPVVTAPMAILTGIFVGIPSFNTTSWPDGREVPSPEIFHRPYSGKDDPNAPKRIALGQDEDLPAFSKFTFSAAYWQWGAYSANATTRAAYQAAIIRLGFLPNTTFHFNLSTRTGLVNSLANLKTNANTILTGEYLTVSSLFKSKTTYYTKSGTIWKPFK